MSSVPKKLSVRKALTVAGLILVWAPIVFPVALSAIKLIESGMFLFDFLMPAEMFLFFLSGAVLLFWVSLKIKHYVKHIGLGLLLAVVFLFGAQGMAVATGLASGGIEPKGWPLVVVLVTLFLYISAVIGVGVMGFYLLKKIGSNDSASPKSDVSRLG